MSLKKIWAAALAALAAVGLVPATGRATSMSAPATVADMVRDASEIVVGTVKDVREVRQGALPVMEVEVAVSESIRGGAGATIASGSSPHRLEGRSADGTTVASTAATNKGFKAFVVNMPSVIVCHVPRKHSEQKQSIAVEWADDDLREHLEHGDTVGICGNGH